MSLSPELISALTSHFNELLRDHGVPTEDSDWLTNSEYSDGLDWNAIPPEGIDHIALIAHAFFPAYDAPSQSTSDTMVVNHTIITLVVNGDTNNPISFMLTHEYTESESEDYLNQLKTPLTQAELDQLKTTYTEKLNQYKELRNYLEQPLPLEVANHIPFPEDSEEDEDDEDWD